MENIIDQVKLAALEEIKKFGTPKLEHFFLANAKGQELAEKLNADKNIVLLGTILMDFKLGQCLSKNRVADHIKESDDAAKSLLISLGCEERFVQKVTACIQSHHGQKTYPSLEAEICANADCYRFLSPAGFFNGFMLFCNRGLSIEECLKNVEAKVDEKRSIISLDICKAETEAYYQEMKDLLAGAQ